MDACRFCGNLQGLTGKHPVPLWFLHEAQADLDRITSFTLLDIASLMDGSLTFPNVVERVHDNRTDYLVCENCSAGWIRTLDREAREPFTSLLHRPFPGVASVLESVEYLKSFSASWREGQSRRSCSAISSSTAS